MVEHYCVSAVNSQYSHLLFLEKNTIFMSFQVTAQQSLKEQGLGRCFFFSSFPKRRCFLQNLGHFHDSCVILELTFGWNCFIFLNDAICWIRFPIPNCWRFSQAPVLCRSPTPISLPICFLAFAICLLPGKSKLGAKKWLKPKKCFGDLVQKHSIWTPFIDPLTIWDPGPPFLEIIRHCQTWYSTNSGKSSSNV